MAVVGLLPGNAVPVIFALRATEYMLVACAMLWMYDYFITLDREIALVWPSQWSLGKVMFFLNRYSPIIDIILMNFIFQGVRNQRNCGKFIPAVAWLLTTGLLWSAIIPNMKAWAIWGGNRYVLYFLIALTTGTHISACILTQMFLQSITYIPIPEFLTPTFGLTCAPLSKQGATWTLFLVCMVNQAVVASLALTRGFREYRLTRSRLLGIMFHDGLLYYVYTLVLVIANMLLAPLTSMQWGFFLILPLRVLSSMFCTRVLLNIKGTYFEQFDRTYIENGVKLTNFGYKAQRGRGHSSRSRSIRDGSMTVETHKTDVLLENTDEDEHFPPSQGWTWSVPMQPLQLTLRPMTPFNADLEMA